jgi:hypothetical protein
MDVQAATIVITGIGVLIAAINQIYTSRQANQQRAIEIKNQELALQAQEQALETRQAELFMQIYNRWNTREMLTAYGLTRFIIGPQVKDFEDWRTNHSLPGGQQNLKTWLPLQLLGTYFEGLGMLVKKGLIDVAMVDDLFAGRIIWFWEAWEKIAKGARAFLQDPQLYDSTEYLYNAIKARDQ